MAEPSLGALVRRFFDALADGDVATTTDLLAQDVVWHLPAGETILGSSRDLVGLQALTESMVANLVATEGTFSFDVRDVYAGDEFAVAISRNTAQREGAELDLRMAISMRIVDDKIVEVWEAPDDLAAFLAFWQAR